VSVSYVCFKRECKYQDPLRNICLYDPSKGSRPCEKEELKVLREKCSICGYEVTSLYPRQLQANMRMHMLHHELKGEVPSEVIPRRKRRR
jgi:hypothetical protein